MYLLDTDIVVGWLRNNKQAIDKVKSLLESEIELSISSINMHELIKGANLSRNPAKNLEKINILAQTLSILPFDRGCAEISGKLSAEQESEGRLIGQNDLLIASVAIKNRLKLVTRNKKHFDRIETLEIEEW